MNRLCYKDITRIILVAVLLLLLLSIIGKCSDYMEQKNFNKNVVERECVYQDGNLKTMEGDNFIVNYNLKNGTLIKVRFYTNGTDTYSDDIPFEYNKIKED